MNSLSAQQLILGTGALTLSGNSLLINGSNPINGTSNAQIANVSGLFNVSLSNGSVYLVNTLLSSGISGTGSFITGTFPNASGLIGYIFTVKDWNGNSINNNIVLTGINGQTFDGNNSTTMSINYLSYNFISNGTNWNLV